MLVVAIALSLATGAVAPAARAATSKAAWDPRVAAIAKDVERLRGLKFERPVPAAFLSDAAFDKKVAISQRKLSADDKAQIERAAAQLRAAGLLADDIDLREAMSSLQTAYVLAYYDPKTKRVTVRGTQLDPATEVTLAHELTHALQDQHFDLEKLQRAASRSHSSDALKALVEGDAVRVQQMYTAGLPADERARYDAASRSSSDTARAEARASSVPDSLLAFVQSSYLLGPLMLQVARAVNGEHAIDRLFRDPPTNDSAYLTPTRLVDGTKVRAVAPPKLARGERVEGKPDVFGAFALYLILASRSDPVPALAVADGWAGDSMVTFRRNGRTCVRASFAGRTNDASNAIGDALGHWAEQGSPGAADVERHGRLSTLTACDPGASGVPSHDGSMAALIVADVRNTLLATLTEQGVGIAPAQCTANGVVRDPAVRPLVDATVADPNATPDPALLASVRQRVVAIAAECASRNSVR